MTAIPRKQSMEDRIRELERRLDDLERSSPLRNASVGEGGLRVYGGGSIRFLTEDGDEVASLSGDGLTFRNAAGDVVAKFDADGYIRTGAIVDDNGVDLNSSFADMAALTFTPPASWGDYRLVAQGTVSMDNNNIDNRKQSRLLIGGNAGDTLTDNFGGTSIYVHPVSHSVDGLTGQVKVAVQSRQLDSNPSPNKMWAALSFTAIRTS